MGSSPDDCHETSPYPNTNQPMPHCAHERPRDRMGSMLSIFKYLFSPTSVVDVSTRFDFPLDVGLVPRELECLSVRGCLAPTPKVLRHGMQVEGALSSMHGRLDYPRCG